MKKVICSLVLTFGLIISSFSSILAAEDLVVADFEVHPNKLGGEVGVYGSLEPNWDDKNTPYSWYYAPNTPGYDAKNIHGGKQSFRLVNALGMKKDESWGSFSMDLGPLTDAVSVPKKVKSKDVTAYKYLTFWVKGEKGGEKMELLFRDSRAPSYMPQGKYAIEEATTEWKEITVPLDGISKMGVDLKSLDNIGIAFGPDAGNKPGAVVYIDDFAFTSNQ